MKKMRKALAALLAGVVATGLLAGCGSASASKSGAEKGNSVETDTKKGNRAGEGDSYEIDIELLLGMPNPDLEEVEAAINEITLDKLNCTVKFREINIADHATQMNLLGAGDDKLDLIWCGYTTQPAQLKDSGVLLGIGDLLKEYAPDLMEKCGRLMDGCRIGDDIYFVPTTLYPGAQKSFMYDKDLAEQYKLKIPDNIADDPVGGVEQFFENVKSSDFAGYSTSMGDGFTPPVVLMPDNDVEPFGDTTTCSYGVLMNMSKDTKIVDLYETQEYADTVRMIRKWHDNEYIVPDSLTNGSTLVDAITSGQIIGSLGIADVSYLGNQEKVTGKTFESLPYGNMSISGSKLGEYGLGVTTASENPEKVCEFLNLLYTDAELSNLMNYGIEGKHYVKESDHIIGFPEGVDFSNLGYGNQICTFGDPMLNYQRSPFTEEYYTDLQNYAIDNCEVSKSFGYYFDISNIKTQAAAVSSVINEYGPSLACGVVDVDTKLPEFIQALKDAGIGDVIAENQKQFDAWLAEQS